MPQNKRVIISMSEKLLTEVDEFIKEKEEVYQSRAHFVRCSIIKTIKKEK